MTKKKRRRKYRINYKRVFIQTSILILIIILIKNNVNKKSEDVQVAGSSEISENTEVTNLDDDLNDETPEDVISSDNDGKYGIIKQDTNTNYSGIGQAKVKGQDGYFTTFTTTDGKTYKEYKQTGTASWSDNPYWGGTMTENGCGITSLSIILSGYGKDYTPEDLRQKYYPVLNPAKISSTLSLTYGIENSDFYFDQIHISKEKMKEQLDTGKPILICVWDEPTENRWTKLSHYMVLLAADDNGMVYISNPNGMENDSKSSGWYNFDEVLPYIAKAIYIES